MGSQPSKNINSGVWILALSAVCWSLGGLLVKSVQWSAISLVTVRGLLSCIVYSFMIDVRKVRLNKVKVLSGFCYFMEGIFLILANKYTTAGCATALQNSSPLFILILNAIFRKVYPKKSEVITCLLLFLGIGLCLAGGFREGKLFGNVMGIISAIFYAGVFFTNSMEGSDALESLWLGNMMYVLLIPILFTDSAVRTSSGTDLLYVLAFSVLTGTIAWYLFSRGIRTTPPLLASFVVMLEPVLSPVWTLVFLGEKMGVLSIIGCVIVIATVLFYSRISKETESVS